MNLGRLLAEDIIDKTTGAHYNSCTSIKYATTESHCHDFFEIFLITKGSVIHKANGMGLKLEEGTLVFIRPDDVHSYEMDGEQDMQFINIAFLKSTMGLVLNFLEDEVQSEAILNPITPPITFLNKNEKQFLQHRMEQLNLIPMEEKLLKRTEYRLLILEIVTRYFKVKNLSGELSMPHWMKHALHEINKKENFTSGIPALVVISGRSHEHLCREFKKYLKVSPTIYLNNLKLNYAANLLSHTDIDIITVAFEAGFGNLSHFNHLFKEKFGVTPSVFRRDNRRWII